MKIALCAESGTPESAVDRRFGRAAYFAFFDQDAQQWQFAPNQTDLQAAQGAGIQAAQRILDARADVLIACNVGPKAASALNAAGVRIVSAAEGLTLAQALKMYQAGQLPPLTQANVEGHWQ